MKYLFLTKIKEIHNDASLREMVIIDIVSLHYTILHCTAELDQLKKGLSSLGILYIINHNSSIMALQ
uniref:Uncharacterized protein n=1 Tax=Amphimedon queenslandica TaxID=400682 RepID=A0A1X7SRE9_AMPQE